MVFKCLHVRPAHSHTCVLPHIFCCLRCVVQPVLLLCPNTVYLPAAVDVGLQDPSLAESLYYMNLYNLVAADGPTAVAQATAPLKENFRQLVTTLGELRGHAALSWLSHKGKPARCLCAVQAPSASPCASHTWRLSC
jgi:hypothetical protein